MNDKQITVQDVAKAALEVIDDRGDDFVYEPREVSYAFNPTCRYSDDGGETGSCLFGAALIDKLGVKYDPSWEGQPIGMLLSGLGVPTFWPNSSHDLDDIQASQDSASPYGELRSRLEFLVSQ